MKTRLKSMLALILIMIQIVPNCAYAADNNIYEIVPEICEVVDINNETNIDDSREDSKEEILQGSGDVNLVGGGREHYKVYKKYNWEDLTNSEEIEVDSIPYDAISEPIEGGGLVLSYFICDFFIVPEDGYSIDPECITTIPKEYKFKITKIMTADGKWCYWIENKYDVGTFTGGINIDVHARKIEDVGFSIIADENITEIEVRTDSYRSIIPEDSLYTARSGEHIYISATNDASDGNYIIKAYLNGNEVMTYHNDSFDDDNNGNKSFEIASYDLKGTDNIIELKLHRQYRIGFEPKDDTHVYICEGDDIKVTESGYEISKEAKSKYNSWFMYSRNVISGNDLYFNVHRNDSDGMYYSEIYAKSDDADIIPITVNGLDGEKQSFFVVKNINSDIEITTGVISGELIGVHYNTEAVKDLIITDREGNSLYLPENGGFNLQHFTTIKGSFTISDGYELNEVFADIDYKCETLKTKKEGNKYSFEIEVNNSCKIKSLTISAGEKVRINANHLKSDIKPCYAISGERHYYVNGDDKSFFKNSSKGEYAIKGETMYFALKAPFNNYKLGIKNANGDITPLEKLDTVQETVTTRYNQNKVEEYGSYVDVYGFTVTEPVTIVEMHTPDYYPKTKSIHIENQLPEDGYEFEVNGRHDDSRSYQLLIENNNTLEITINRMAGSPEPVVECSNAMETTVLTGSIREDYYPNGSIKNVKYDFRIPYDEIYDNSLVTVKECVPVRKKVELKYDKNIIPSISVYDDCILIKPYSVTESDSIISEVYEVYGSSFAYTINGSNTPKYVLITRNGKQERTEFVQYYNKNNVILDGDAIIEFDDYIYGAKKSTYFEVAIKNQDEWRVLDDLDQIVFVPGYGYRIKYIVNGEEVKEIKLTGDIGINEIEVEAKENALYFNIGENARKSDYTYKKRVSYVDKEGKYKEDELSFNIDTVPESIKLKNANITNGKLLCNIDNEYNIQYDYDYVDLSVIGVEVNYVKDEYKDLIYTNRENDRLKLFLSPGIDVGDVAKLRFYRKDRLPEDKDYYIKVEINGENDTVKILNEITVTGTLSNVMTDGVIKIKDEWNSDTNLRFNAVIECGNGGLGSDPVIGKRYLEVKINPKKVDGIQTPVEIHPKTEYIEQNRYYGNYIDIKVSDYPEYFGISWPYDVEISIVQTKNKTKLTSENASEIIAYRSTHSTKVEMSTSDATYETNIRVKKGASKLYTGQKDVQIATVQYSAGTTGTNVIVEDVTDCKDEEKIVLSTGRYGEVNATVPLVASLGNHTIEITPVGPDIMYQNSKYITVKVVKGIENLIVDIPSPYIYKKDGKAATMTASVRYNNGDKAPSAKKVKWEICDENGNKWNLDHVAVNNGKIKIKSDYIVPAYEDRSTFYVKAIANDFSGNEVYAVSRPIVIRNNALEAGDIYFAKYNERTGKYDVYDSNKTEFYSSEMEGVHVFASVENPGAEIDEETVIKYSKSGKKLTSSNKSVKVKEDEIGNKIIVSAVANSVKFTVKTMDGGNKSNTKTVNVINYEPSDLKLSGFISENCIGTENQTEWVFNGTVNTRIRLQLRKKDNNEDIYSDVKNATKHSLKISGGKVISGNSISGAYTIVVTGPKATITFKDNKNQQTVYTIINNSYSAEKSPKVKVANSIISGAVNDRKLKLTVDPSTYDITGKTVRVEMDAITYKKNEKKYVALEKACDSINSFIVASEEMKFDINNTMLEKGKYKLVLTFGKMEGDIFKADAKPVTVNVSVKPPKKTYGNCKVSKNLVLNSSAGSSESIIFTGSYSSVSINAIKSVNTLGKPNSFSDYFNVKTVNEGNETITKIELKPTLTKEQMDYITGRNGKKDCYFYVIYTYAHGNNGYDKPIISKKAAKVMVKFTK